MKILKNIKCVIFRLIPDDLRYLSTTPEPGDRLVLIYGRTASPASTAFFASNPDPSITVGFEVFVHDVIAAITIEP